MCHNNNNDKGNSSEELRIIRAEILYRNDKIDELMLDIADEMKILKDLLSREERYCEAHKREEE